MPDQVVITDVVVIAPEDTKVKKTHKRVIQKVKDGKEEVSTQQSTEVTDKKVKRKVKKKEIPSEEEVTFEEVSPIEPIEHVIPLVSKEDDLAEHTTIETKTIISKEGEKKRVKKQKVVRKIKDGKEDIQVFEETPEEGILLDEGSQVLPEITEVVPERVDEMPDQVVITDVVVIAPEDTKVKKTHKRVIQKVKDGKEEVSTQQSTEVTDKKVKRKVKKKEIPSEEEVTFEEVSPIEPIEHVIPLVSKEDDLAEHTTIETKTIISKEGEKKRVKKQKVVRKIKDGKEDIQVFEETPEEGILLDEGSQVLPEITEVVPERVDEMPDQVVITDVVVIAPEDTKVKKTHKRVIQKVKDEKEVSTQQSTEVTDKKVKRKVKKKEIPSEEEVTFEEVSPIEPIEHVIPLVSKEDDLAEHTTIETKTIISKEGEKKRVKKQKVVKKIKDGKEDIQVFEETPEEGILLDEGSQVLPEITEVVPERVDEMPDQVVITDVVVIAPEDTKVKKTHKRVIQKVKDGKEEVSTQQSTEVTDKKVKRKVKKKEIPSEEEVTFEEVSPIEPIEHVIPL
ncbi:hypothetical protein J6590_107844, partial [Homalodisca vitripennis]